jgi:hypothetical protein
LRDRNEALIEIILLERPPDHCFHALIPLRRRTLDASRIGKHLVKAGDL